MVVIMPVIIEWLIPGRVIYVAWFQDVTWELVAQVSDALLASLDNGEMPVHIVGDARFADEVQVLNLGLRREKNFVDHAHLGWTINIAHRPGLEQLGNALPQHMRLSTYRSFENVDDALFFLSIQDDTLDWDSANRDLIPAYAFQ